MPRSKQFEAREDDGACTLYTINKIHPDLLEASDLDKQIDIVHSLGDFKDMSRERIGIDGESWHFKCVQLALEEVSRRSGVSYNFNNLGKEGLDGKEEGMFMVVGKLNHRWFNRPPTGNWNHTLCVDLTNDIVHCKNNELGDYPEVMSPARKVISGDVHTHAYLREIYAVYDISKVGDDISKVEDDISKVVKSNKKKKPSELRTIFNDLKKMGLKEDSPGSFMVVGKLNHELFDEPDEGDWTHTVRVDTINDVIRCDTNEGGDFPIVMSPALKYLLGGYGVKPYFTDIYEVYNVNEDESKQIELEDITLRVAAEAVEEVESVPSAAKVNAKKKVAKKNAAFNRTIKESTKKVNYTPKYSGDLWDSPHKKVANKQILLAAHLHLQDVQGSLAVIDAQQANSSRMLIKEFPNRQITFINDDPMIIAQALETYGNELGNCNFFSGRADKWISKQEIRSTALLWLDYCGAIDGNVSKGMFPRDDLKLALDKEIFTDGALLGITLCKRGNKSTTILTRVHAELLKTIQEKYPLAGIVTDIQYTSMSLIIFRLGYQDKKRNMSWVDHADSYPVHKKQKTIVLNL
jgi:hypothetical protein